MREGIEWQHVDYFNNKIICDLVEEPHKGVLAVLDEACLVVGKVTDAVSIKLFFYNPDMSLTVFYFRPVGK